MVVPYAPGGNIDQAARVFGRELSEKLGQQFIVESKGGAGGSLGAAKVAKSKPDGYTLLVTANGPAVLNKMLYASLPYDPDTDFTPISLISDVPQAFIVNPKSPVNDLKGLVALGKQKNGALTIGSSGHRHRRTSGDALVRKSHRHQSSSRWPIGAPSRSSRRCWAARSTPGCRPTSRRCSPPRSIAVTSEQRVDFLPDVPTARESGIDIATGTFTALAAPAGTPPEIVTRINRILEEFLKTDAAKKQLALLGAKTLGGPPSA